jgi:dUTP pyrophosphatase
MEDKKELGVTLTIERLDPSLPMPKYAKEGDSGFDLHMSLRGSDLLVHHQDTVKIPTGVRCCIPDGYELQIRPRSSMNHKGLIANFGTVDAGYRGELQVSITNVGNSTMKLRHGDRIAQAVLAPVTRANIVEGVVSTDTERGTVGFGSTVR